MTKRAYLVVFFWKLHFSWGSLKLKSEWASFSFWICNNVFAKTKSSFKFCAGCMMLVESCVVTSFYLSLFFVWGWCFCGFTTTSLLFIELWWMNGSLLSPHVITWVAMAFYIFFLKVLASGGFRRFEAVSGAWMFLRPILGDWRRLQPLSCDSSGAPEGTFKHFKPTSSTFSHLQTLSFAYRRFQEADFQAPGGAWKKACCCFTVIWRNENQLFHRNIQNSTVSP